MNKDHVDWLEAAIGVPAEFLPIEEGGKKVHVALWRDQPEPGMALYASVGLSAVPIKGGPRVELLLSVRSREAAWGLALGLVVAQARGYFSFDVGETIDFREQIAPDSEMRGFLIVPQMMLPEDLSVISIGEFDLEFRQLAPIYDEELQGIRARGPGFFARQEPEVDSVRRPRVRFDVA